MALEHQAERPATLQVSDLVRQLRSNAGIADLRYQILDPRHQASQTD
jgi:hypothetical protein